MQTFHLTLQPTYYRHGFFNVAVACDHHLRPDEGPVLLKLGRHGVDIEARVTRRANRNGTARVYGGARLRDWFQRSFAVGDTVDIDLQSPNWLVLEAGAPAA